MAEPLNKKTTEDVLKLHKEINQEYNLLIRNANAAKDAEGERLLVSEQISQNNKIINELQSRLLELNDSEKQKLLEIRKIQGELIKGQKEENVAIQEGNKARQQGVNFAKELIVAAKGLWTHLQSQDKIIRTTVLNLGLSGIKAEAMRTSFENSAIFAARLGANLEDLQTIQQGYAEETGRARVLSAEMLKDIISIGKGTGLGIEQATKLGAQFEIMGFNTKATMNYVQGVVDTSERMGVNTTKVLKNVSDNFKKLNTYNFQQGVKGFAQMAMYAEKFKIDISDALNSADIARTLEGSIDMVSQLQVMGGEFAKMDMFETLYFARNDPAKLQEKIAGLTKNLVTMRKTSDGTFEKFISPADRDRLTGAGKALGISADKMTEMAERAWDVEKMTQQLQGMGLTDREKELITGAGIMESKTGKFQVELAGTMTDISKLTATQAKSFAKEQVLLQDRAKESQTFDETFKATIDILKSSLLPLLRVINSTVLPVIKWLANLAASGWGGLVSTAGILLAAAAAWKVTGNIIGRAADKFVESGKFGALFRGKGDTTTTNTSSGGSRGGSSKWFTGKGNIKKGAPELAKAQGMKNLGTGAGIGAAMVGAGAGIGLAAVGISKLADSMSKLTDKQAQNLAIIATTLAITFPLAALGLALFAPVATAAAPPLYALGGALLMIGGAVGIAAAGIGLMGFGLGAMFKNAKGAGEDLMSVGKGMAIMAASMIGFSAGGLGFIVFAATMATIAKNASAMEKVGNSFANIKAVMSGSKDDFIAIQKAVESISKINTRGGGMLADLANLLKSPLKVEFANNGQVQLRNDITLEIDGTKFFNKNYDVSVAIERHQSAYHGKSSNK